MKDQAYIEQLKKEYEFINHYLPKYPIKDWKEIRGAFDTDGPFRFIEVDRCIAMILGAYTIETKKQLFGCSETKKRSTSQI